MAMPMSLNAQASVNSNNLVSNCGYKSSRPDNLTEFCADAGAGLVKIKWNTWGATQATGTGIYQMNGCVPDCTSGKWSNTNVKVLLSNIEKYQGKTYYTKVTVTSLDSKGLPLAGSKHKKIFTTSWTTQPLHN